MGYFRETTAYFETGPKNKCGLNQLIQIYPGPDWPPNRTKARYLQKRKLRRGGEAYYWVPPQRAITQGFNLSAESLGSDFIRANVRAEFLNAYLDAWRKKVK